MANGAKPTLSRKPAAPAVVPVYDPTMCSELRGGVGLVQGTNVFTEIGHKFLKTLPQEQGYFLTPEQQINYKRQMAKQRQMLSPLSVKAPPEPIPDKVIEVARENAMALAAESYAE